MHISWLGTTALRLQTKPFDQDVVIIIDPYRPTRGDFPRSLAPDIALFTHGSEGAITLSQDPFIISHPGEYESKGILITGIPGREKGEVFYRIDVEHMSIAHLGMTKQMPTDQELEALSGIDILCLSVGGQQSGGIGFDAETAAKVVNTIEARTIIPLGFESDNDPNAAPVSLFLKELGHAPEQGEKKIIFKKKDLPQGDTRVIVLMKE